MKRNVNAVRGITLLTAGVLLCLGAGSAQCQRGGRQVGRASFSPRFANQATSNLRSANQTTSNQRSANQTSGSQATANQATTTPTSSTSTTSGQSGSCPGGSSSTTSSGSTTTGTTTATSTTTSQSSAPIVYTGNAQSSQSSSGITVSRTASNTALVRWNGSTSNVATVYVAVLNANRQAIAQKAVTQGPVQANLPVTTSARYYGVQVVYANGQTNTMYLPIR